jgi:putative aldouronate transport system permease protein
MKGDTMRTVLSNNINIPKAPSFMQRLKRDLVKNKGLYLLVLPVLAFYLIFHYKPMYGAMIAFKNYSPAKGVLGSPWVGLKHFQSFFGSHYFLRILKNTVTISLTNLAFGFPAPIILALLINELRVKWYSKLVQTLTYLPHFISLVVICGMIKDFTLDTGLINYIIEFFGGKPQTLLSVPSYFVPIYVISDIWQGVGWGSIIYLAALMSIDQQLYEAAEIDGAGKWKQTLHVTLPGILPTIAVMFILRVGNILNVGFEKIILLYNPVIYDTADVISTFVYRKGLLEFNWSYSSAVGLFNSVINFTLLITTNWLSKKFNETSLW